MQKPQTCNNVNSSVLRVDTRCFGTTYWLHLQGSSWDRYVVHKCRYETNSLLVTIQKTPRSLLLTAFRIHFLVLTYYYYYYYYYYYLARQPLSLSLTFLTTNTHSLLSKALVLQLSTPRFLKPNSTSSTHCFSPPALLSSSFLLSFRRPFLIPICIL